MLIRRLDNHTMKWNKTECLEFLRRFDAFEHKYLFAYNKELARKKVSTQIAMEHNDLWNDILDAQFHSRANHNLSYRDEASAALGIAQVYKDAGRYTNEYIEMLNLVRDRFIYDYTGISGLCDFFSPAYFEYEWGMHLEIDYNKHDSRYYRDHYVHQIRNLFEMFTLLDEFGYYDKCWNAYSNPESRVGTYIFEAIEKELLSLTDTDRRYYRSILELNGYTQTGSCCETTEEYHAAMRKLMFHYIVYSATIIAALVHDIGYPISYIRRISTGIGKNLPICQLLTSVSNDYAAIEQTLQTSLLFNVALSDRIKNRMEDTEEHGAQSAVVLLMYFYQHGQNLSILQHCAIEVAALIIYNHTNKFAIINKKKVPDLIRSDIYKEPLSHIFRMCDDLQEWDRVYFEVTDQNNIKVCPECGTPITRLFISDRVDPCERKYFCCCRNADDGIYDTSWFVSRRIINVIACDELTVDTIEDRDDKDNSIGTRFVLNYDSGALLNIMMFSSSFAKVRAECINQLKILHSYQGMTDSVLFDAFVSGNPFTVKIRILEEYGIDRFVKLISNPDNMKETLSIATKQNIVEEWRKNISFYLVLRKTGKEFCEKCKRVIDKLPNIRSIGYLWLAFITEFGKDYEDILIIHDDNKKPSKKSSAGHNNSDTSIEEGDKCIIYKDDIDSFKKFASASYNNTNTSVVEIYEGFYKVMQKCLTAIAKKYLHDSINGPVLTQIDKTEYVFAKTLEKETVQNLAVDYMLQQVHLLGYSVIKEHVETINDININKKNTVTDIRLLNLYRIFYENLYCMSDKLRICVDKYISRSDYEDVKRNILLKQNVNDRIDFFIDYALFIKLWDTAKKRRSYYFTAQNVKRRKGKLTRTIDNVDDTLSIRYLGDLEKEDTILECITEESEFEGKYEFYIHKQHDRRWSNEGSFILSIDEKNSKGHLDSNDCPKIRNLLEPLRAHHGFEWNA